MSRRQPLAAAPRFHRPMWPAGRFRVPPRVAFRATRDVTLRLPNGVPETLDLAAGDTLDLAAGDWLGHPDDYAVTVSALRRHPALREVPA